MPNRILIIVSDYELLVEQHKFNNAAAGRLTAHISVFHQARSIFALVCDRLLITAY